MSMSRKLLPLAAFAALFMFCSVFLTADIPQCMAAPEWALAAPQTWLDEVNLIARLIMGEATGEPLAGQVAVGAVILNRVRSPEFPNTVAGVVYDPWAFESVENGLIWSREPTPENIRAAELALNGWDPTYGALFFWNPSKPVSPWIWTRSTIVQIGSHVFGR
jgi:N-acetylmuramoyl-L-alanine amidase